MVWNNNGLFLLVLLSGMLHHLAGINHLLRVQRKTEKTEQISELTGQRITFRIDMIETCSIY